MRKHVSEKEKAEEGLGPNIKSVVTMLMLMLLMMFAVHCTWVTSNAYSSPSVVLASYNHDGYDGLPLTCAQSTAQAGGSQSWHVNERRSRQERGRTCIFL